MPRLSKIGAAALAAFGWTGLSTVTATYLQVAGGGGGGGEDAGGGGAGGYLTGTTSLNPTQSYTVVVGAGGAGGYGTGASNNGSNSQFGSLTTSIGGGGGGSYPGQSANGPGHAGGSGGGGGSASTGNTPGTGGAATSGQGNAGGAGLASSTYYAGGGGGGAGQAGFAGSAGAGNGGAGLANSITGSSVYYAGGGGGGSAAGPSSGGLGGGGAGYTGGTANSFATSGTANLGGGGGGGGDASTASGGNGGSGVVIISYPSPQKFGGGIVTTSGSNTIHTFRTSGTLSPLSTLSASYLIVAGGGSGSGGGGGGAGGMQTGSGVVIDTNSTYVITVGAGGASTLANNSSQGSSGTNSTFSAYATASVGGGGGGFYNGGSGSNGSNGGSGGGGGGANSPTSGGTATSGQGNAGGGGISAGGRNPSGGGGGAGGVGGTATTASTSTGGNGGAGLASSISGTSVTYAGGGGGAGDVSGTGGSGGGGNATTTGAGVAGTANLGGGGGGVFNNYIPGAGGSGIVIISYAGSVQQMAGGTVTISGGNVIHTFTSSGYLTPLKLVNNSLRFRSSATAYLSRSVTSTPTSNKWTFSAWVKRGKLSSAANSALVGAYRSSTSVTQIYFMDSDVLRVFSNGSGGNLDYQTTAVYRDPAAWYHIVVSIDNTTSTTAFAMYVNGVQITSFGTSTNTLGQNNGIAFNLSGGTSYLANCITTGNANFAYGDLYMSEVNCIDGQALTPNSFGTFNSYGVWQPITYGGSYGTNGFYLPFTNKTSTTTLGYDFSPAGNNWTTNNISLTTGSTYDSMTDVPTLTSATTANYAVMNPLINGSSLINGNLKQNTSAPINFATIGQSSGKWYWEVTITTQSTAAQKIGIANSTATGELGDTATGWAMIVQTNANGQSINNGSLSSSYTTFAQGDILNIAVDVGGGKVWWGKNGTWLNSGVPASGTGAIYTNVSGAIFPAASNIDKGVGSGVLDYNFGQQPFVYTPPTGYVALNTYNL